MKRRIYYYSSPLGLLHTTNDCCVMCGCEERRCLCLWLISSSLLQCGTFPAFFVTEPPHSPNLFVPTIAHSRAPTQQWLFFLVCVGGRGRFCHRLKLSKTHIQMSCVALLQLHTHTVFSSSATLFSAAKIAVFIDQLPLRHQLLQVAQRWRGGV